MAKKKLKKGYNEHTKEERAEVVKEFEKALKVIELAKGLQVEIKTMSGLIEEYGAILTLQEEKIMYKCPVCKLEHNLDNNPEKVIQQD